MAAASANAAAGAIPPELPLGVSWEAPNFKGDVFLFLEQLRVRCLQKKHSPVPGRTLPKECAHKRHLRGKDQTHTPHPPISMLCRDHNEWFWLAKKTLVLVGSRVAFSSTLKFGGAEGGDFPFPMTDSSGAAPERAQCVGRLGECFFCKHRREILGAETSGSAHFPDPAKIVGLGRDLLFCFSFFPPLSPISPTLSVSSALAWTGTPRPGPGGDFFFCSFILGQRRPAHGAPALLIGKNIR